MGLIFVQHIADHTLINQNRFRGGRRCEDQFSTRIGFSFRHGRTNTAGVIGEGTAWSFVVHDPGQGDASAGKGSESMDAVSVY